jgi:hypothetical protein
MSCLRPQFRCVDAAAGSPVSDAPIRCAWHRRTLRQPGSRRDGRHACFQSQHARYAPSPRPTEVSGGPDLRIDVSQRVRIDLIKASARAADVPAPEGHREVIPLRFVIHVGGGALRSTTMRSTCTSRAA